VDLAPGVGKGEAYRIVARQITTYATDLDAPQRDAGASARVPSFEWRILSAFRTTVPIATKEELLGPTS
jgi:hypothetical protein